MNRKYTDLFIMTTAGIIIILLMIFIQPQEKVVVLPVEEEQHVPPETAYGIVIDSFSLIKEKVKPNQYLSEILLSFGIEYPLIDKIVKKSDSIFDVRKIKAGNTYAMITSRDTLHTPLYFIYEDSPTSYIVYDLADSITIYKEDKEIKKLLRTASGVIETSLWNTLVESNTNPILALELSEVYAWAIDFFGLQQGDIFKVIYEVLEVEGEVIGLGKIRTSVFTHNNRDFYAFYYFQDSIGDYFDEEAQSLRRTFLKAPLRFSRISSRFSYSRMHPILKYRRPHLGVDYAAPYGTPVQAIGDGTVISVGYSGGAGHMVKIKHNGTYTTAYLHLLKYGPGIKKGVYVKQGDVIGYVGSTGLSTGPHLDFRFYKNGEAVDPLKVESPPAEPIDSAYMKDYMLTVDSMKKELGKIDVMKKDL